MSEALQLPVIDLCSEDHLSTAKSIHQADHGVEEELLKKVYERSKKFFSLPVEEKIKFALNNRRGYNGLYDEKLDTSLNAIGDFKESFYVVGPLSENHLNQWPSKGDVDSSGEEIYGAIARSDYGMITLLLIDGVPGFQVCWEKSEKRQVWEDLPTAQHQWPLNIGSESVGHSSLTLGT